MCVREREKESQKKQNVAKRYKSIDIHLLARITVDKFIAINGEQSTPEKRDVNVFTISHDNDKRERERKKKTSINCLDPFNFDSGI